MHDDVLTSFHQPMLESCENDAILGSLYMNDHNGTVIKDLSFNGLANVRNCFPASHWSQIGAVVANMIILKVGFHDFCAPPYILSQCGLRCRRFVVTCRKT